MSNGITVYATRKFPPSTGGMELLASDIHGALADAGPVRLIANGRSQSHLPWWLPLAAARVAIRPNARVVCGDPVLLAALAPGLLARKSVPTTVVVHGLDLTYSAPGYRPLMRRVLGRADRVIAISRATSEVAATLGVPFDRIRIVNPSVELPVSHISRTEARQQLGISSEAPVLVTVGRLVPRKGVRWFVDNVLPLLDPPPHYVVVGSGPDFDALAAMRPRLDLRGPANDTMRDTLVRAADAVIMPNIAVPGDMEGFGLVAAEAAVRDTLVIASELEGVTDAVAGGRTGWLCPAGDAQAWAAAVTKATTDLVACHQAGEQFGKVARELFAPQRFRDEFLGGVANERAT